MVEGEKMVGGELDFEHKGIFALSFCHSSSLNRPTPYRIVSSHIIIFERNFHHRGRNMIVEWSFSSGNATRKYFMKRISLRF